MRSFYVRESLFESSKARAPSAASNRRQILAPPPPNLVSSNRLNGLDPSPPLQGQGQGKDKMSAPKYQPYAPSPYSYTPSPHSLSTSISLDEEVKLSTTSQQRELNESLAEIFSIIVTLDFLEKAYIKDSINQEEYRTHFPLFA